MQRQLSFRECKFCKRRNQLCSMRTLNDGLIAGEFAVDRHPRSSKPDEWMEPQGTQREFVKQTNQIVTPSCMREFVKQGRDEAFADASGAS